MESPKFSKKIVWSKSKKSLMAKEEHKIKDLSSVLKESAISSFRSSQVNEYSWGEKTFLKDLHKQLAPTHIAQIELIGGHRITPKKDKKRK